MESRRQEVIMDPDTITGATSLDDLDGIDLGADENRIDPGEYVLEFTGASRGTSSQKGTPYIAWKFRVAEGKHRGFPLTLFTYCSKNAVWKARKTAKALGCYDAANNQTSGVADAVGNVVIGVVEDDEYNGEARSRLQEVKPHPEGPDYVPDDDLPF